MDFGLLTLAYRPCFEPQPFLQCNQHLYALVGPVNCPAVICLPHIAVLSSFGRETSLVNIMRLRSILLSLITYTIYFSLFYLLLQKLSITTIILLLTLCELQGRRD